jgi:hypothetical protein
MPPLPIALMHAGRHALRLRNVECPVPVRYLWGIPHWEEEQEYPTVDRFQGHYVPRNMYPPPSHVRL